MKGMMMNHQMMPRAVSAHEAGVMAKFVAPRDVQPGIPTRLTFRLVNARTGLPFTEVAIIHEKFAHLILIRRDLTGFQHLHPEPSDRAGEYAVDATFPAIGTYLLFTEFAQADGWHVLLRDQLVVGTPSGEVATLEEDRVPKMLGDDVRVTLLGAEGIRAGRDSALAFLIENPRTGAPVRDLQPYLGAPAHVVILSRDGQAFAHTHGVSNSEGSQTTRDHGPADGPAGVHGGHGAVGGFGPEIAFQHAFPTSGLYKVWGQFKDRRGHVLVAEFVIYAS